MIWKGVAKYNTWTIGTPTARLTIPKNKTVIMFGVDFFPYIDSQQQDFSNANRSNWLDRCNKQLLFYSKNRRVNFLARSYWESTNGVRPGTTHFACYMPFTENLNFNMATIPEMDLWNITAANTPNESEAQPPPIGYGTEAQASRFGSTQRIVWDAPAFGEMRPDPATPPLNINSFDDFQTPIVTETIEDPLFLAGLSDFYQAVQFPMITVHYVEINESAGAKFI